MPAETRHDVLIRPDEDTPWENVLAHAPWWLAKEVADRYVADGLRVQVVGWECIGPQNFREA